MSKIYLTPQGKKELEEKLDYYKTVKRPEITKKIGEAREFGDLSENAEYDEAKNEQSRLEAEIVELENAIRTAIVIDDENVSTDRVNVGTTVRVAYVQDGDEEEYAIVGARESDPMNNRISNECPIGAALLGKHLGDVVMVEAPDGQLELKILEIRR